ncbi:MAG: cytochrome b, partial [Candidatus Midichloria mitochondrii]|nr:cytochrome b [Candidatus Midichloria mitochondrii]
MNEDITPKKPSMSYRGLTTVSKKTTEKPINGVSTGLTHKLPLEVEFGKNSIIEWIDYRLPIF